jgi:formamidopyrimidine-DNA glycosylase
MPTPGEYALAIHPEVGFMPELPEVETTRSGIEPHICRQTISGATVRNANLRWPVPANLPRLLAGSRVSSVARRGKYILLDCERGHLILHLGMSGSLRLVPSGTSAAAHDHVDIEFSNGSVLRLRDPRRFGAVLWTDTDPLQHRLLLDLGPEPLESSFDANYLYTRSRGRKCSIKHFIMDGHTVVGVGNIYANEALFRAGIRPDRAAGRISLVRYGALVTAIKAVLAQAIAQGGTTLRDFVNGDGKPGYFRQQLQVYGCGGESCSCCGATLKEIRQAQRSTVFCPGCQR